MTEPQHLVTMTQAEQISRVNRKVLRALMRQGKLGGYISEGETVFKPNLMSLLTVVVGYPVEEARIQLLEILGRLERNVELLRPAASDPRSAKSPCRQPPDAGNSQHTSEDQRTGASESRQPSQLDSTSHVDRDDAQDPEESAGRQAFAESFRKRHREEQHVSEDEHAVRS